jgi:hypothetical protein
VIDDLGEFLAQNGTKWNARACGQRYQQYFAALRDKPLKILELGVGGYDDPLPTVSFRPVTRPPSGVVQNTKYAR